MKDDAKHTPNQPRGTNRSEGAGPDFDLMGYHYWRECPACGHAEGGYLHCAHDGYQNPCHNCGERMPTLKGECKCEFVVTHGEVRELVEAARAVLAWHDALRCDGLFPEPRVEALRRALVPFEKETP